MEINSCLQYYGRSLAQFIPTIYCAANFPLTGSNLPHYTSAVSKAIIEIRNSLGNVPCLRISICSANVKVTNSELRLRS